VPNVSLVHFFQEAKYKKTVLKPPQTARYRMNKFKSKHILLLLYIQLSVVCANFIDCVMT